MICRLSSRIVSIHIASVVLFELFLFVMAESNLSQSDGVEEVGLLWVAVKEATIKQAVEHTFGKSTTGYRVQIRVRNKVLKTKFSLNVKNPSWTEEFVVSGVSEGDEVNFSIRDRKTSALGKSHTVGSVSLYVSSLEGGKCVSLDLDATRKDEHTATMSVTIGYFPHGIEQWTSSGMPPLKLPSDISPNVLYSCELIRSPVDGDSNRLRQMESLSTLPMTGEELSAQGELSDIFLGGEQGVGTSSATTSPTLAATQPTMKVIDPPLYGMESGVAAPGLGSMASRDATVSAPARVGKRDSKMILDHASPLQEEGEEEEDGPQAVRKRGRLHSFFKNSKSTKMKKKNDNFQSKFQLPPEEIILWECEAGFLRPTEKMSLVIVHGTMYKSPNYLCFYSNMFNIETVEKVAIQDIVDIKLSSRLQKGKGIVITLKNGERDLEFVSMGATSVVLVKGKPTDIFELLIADWDRGKIAQDDQFQSTELSEISELGGVDEYSKEGADDGSEHVDNFSFAKANSSQSIEVIDEVIENCTLQMYFDNFVKTENLERLYHESRKDTNLRIGAWIYHAKYGYLREVKYHAKVKLQLPNVPSNAPVTEIQRYSLSENCLKFETTMLTHDVPYEGYFRVETNWMVTPIPHTPAPISTSSSATSFSTSSSATSLSYSSLPSVSNMESVHVLMTSTVRFLKKTWLQGQIQSGIFQV